MNILEEIFRELIAAAKLSEDQQKELFSQLQQAISLNFTGKLLHRLSDEQKGALGERQVQTPEELFAYFSEIIPQKDLQKMAGLAVEEVLKSFFDKI